MVVIKTDEAPQAVGPYEQAIEVGGFIYGSGQIPLDKHGQRVLGGVENEAHQVMKNIGAVLGACGLDYKHIVKCSIFLKNMDDFALVNGVYKRYFLSENYPARETVEVARLPKDVNVEISFVAHRGD